MRRVVVNEDEYPPELGAALTDFATRVLGVAQRAAELTAAGEELRDVGRRLKAGPQYMRFLDDMARRASEVEDFIERLNGDFDVVVHGPRSERRAG